MKRQGLSKWFTTGVLALSMLASSTPALASDIFAKIDDIKGESQDSKHKDWIDVLSWSWGTSTGTGRTAKGRQAPACIKDLNLMKLVDKPTRPDHERCARRRCADRRPDCLSDPVITSSSKSS